MWKLNKIEARNLCAFRSLSYTLKQGVTTLVFGDNCDNESQRSNGSGKSSLLECIAVGITGSPLRKVKNEEIINDAAEECFVSLEFSNGSSGEVFTVEREIYRKGSSVVRCFVGKEGNADETGEAVQHSVEAYNRYILEMLGITRDELFNNFILSKHRYEDFLSAPDKEKKEIINHFSNGVLVDQVVVKVQEDIAPVERELQEAGLELAGLDGRIDILSEQIRNEENRKEERAKSKVEKILSIQQTIAAKRDAIRTMNGQIDAKAGTGLLLDTADKEIQLLENSDEPLETCFNGIKMALKKFGTPTDWDAIFHAKSAELYKIQDEQGKLSKEIQSVDEDVNGQKTICEKLKSQYARFVAEADEKSESFKKRLAELEKEMQEAVELSTSLIEKRRACCSAVESLRNKIAGVIRCPRCEFEFVASDSSFDVAEGEKELSILEAELEQTTRKRTEAEKTIVFIEQDQKDIQKARRKLNADNGEWLAKADAADKELQTLIFRLESLQHKDKQITERIASIQKEIEDTRRNMFDEAYEIIDTAVRMNGREIKRLNEDIAAAESSIETLQETIGELDNSSPSEFIDSLKASLETFRKRSKEAVSSQQDIERRLACLREQEQRFGQFKSYLANTKIEALSKITNEFLESIGSDIRVRFSGYTVLKTGKVREKISVSLIRDGMDCGSFGKFSEGEKARVNLSSILAMQKLVNSNCDTDKGLDLLVLDEILAAVDEEGNAKMFESLNRLGITALVVSHGHVSESYPHTLVIRKEHGESRIV